MTLKYKELTIGVLTFADDVWTFIYSDDFKAQSEVRPLFDFPNVDKVYVSYRLPIFFQIRIPSLKRKSIQEIIKKKKINPQDKLELLKAFGYKSICNPFILI